MPGSRASNDPDLKSPRESGEDSEDDSEILEESPCGRWLKRREEVSVCFHLNCNLSLFFLGLFLQIWFLMEFESYSRVSEDAVVLVFRHTCSLPTHLTFLTHAPLYKA